MVSSIIIELYIKVLVYKKFSGIEFYRLNFKRYKEYKKEFGKEVNDFFKDKYGIGWAKIAKGK